MAQGVAAVLAGRQPQFSGDYPCDRPDGRRWYRLLISALASQAATGAVAMHLDVTSRKIAEEALRREKDFSEFLIKSTTEGILVFDRAFRITLWNPGIEAITGMTPEQAMGRSAFDVLPFLVGTAGEGAMRGALEGHEASFFDQRYAVPSTGRHGFYEAYFAPLMSSAREVTGGIGFVRETTERRRRGALRQSQKMEAVGQLTGGIAHDFNNMLMVIIASAEELADGETLGAREQLKTPAAHRRARPSAPRTLTRQLLAFSRKQPLRPRPTNVNDLVTDTGKLLRRALGEQIEIDSSSPTSCGRSTSTVPSSRPRWSISASMRATPCPTAGGS